jgi:hypothetical protein
MEYHRRDDYQITFLISQCAVIEGKAAFTARAVDEFPAAVHMPGDRIGEKMLSCINDLIHRIELLSVVII